jgi:starch synthase
MRASRPAYDEAWDHNPVDFLASGVFGAHFVNTVSPRFLEEIVEGRHDFVEWPLRQELTNKYFAGCGTGILNAPDPAFNPKTDKDIHRNYTAGDHPAGKRENKRHSSRRRWD